ncbi:MAG: mannose-1-phosphate guanylyltransferase [Candidatus Omnitrophica bacterium]|nr:mannose-1-phosphate guanylyltransferase [Candidatus Omnitrophota bacterium]
MMLYCLIMAGGKGERFWPRSRTRNPKQMLSVVTRKTMIEDTLQRLEPFVDKQKIFVITNKQQSSSLKKLAVLGRKRIIAEPLARNTAVAIGLGALLIKKENPQAVIACLPADHVIKKKTQFRKVLSSAASIARRKNALVTIGIKPNYPATGYGYIQAASCKLQAASKKTKKKDKKIFQVEKFIEKPKKEDAEQFLQSGSYFWNSGIFVWKASVILEAIEEHLPQLYSGLMRIENSLGKKEQKEVIERVYNNLKAVSIDYGVMEKAKNVFLVEGDFGWTDLGSWRAYWQFHKKNEKGNVCRGKCVNIDTYNSVVIGDRKRLTAVLGLSNVVVVQTKDAVLVCSQDRTQDVKMLVKEMSRRRGMKKFL